jgi:autotransporter-associated beta strand protein
MRQIPEPTVRIDMKRNSWLITLVAAGLILAAFSPLRTQAAENTWLNTDGDFNWNSWNWAEPLAWIDGDDAVFGTNGIGAINISAPVTARNLTFNSAGYSITNTALTLIGTTPTITANADVTIATSLLGTNGLTVQGSSNVTLLGANSYTGGTFVKNGTLILRSTNANASGTPYAVDSIEAIDPGAVVQFGTVNDGLDTSTSNVRPPNGQITTAGSVSPHRLNLTGGTYDTNGDDNQDQVPQPSGDGTIINTSPYARGILKFVSYGQTTTFSGQIKDGGATIPRANNGPGHQMNVDSQGGTAGTLILAGSNSFSGFIRIGNNGTIQLSGAGTLGYPTVSSPLRQVIQNNGVMDLNGTSQKTGYYYTGNSGSARITNTAIGTLSILTVGFNSTNQATFTNSGVSKGIQTDIQDDPVTGGLIGLTKEGSCVQPLGLSGPGTAPVNNYHGDTTVDDGTLLVFSPGAISPNSIYRLSTSRGTLNLDYTGTVDVRGLFINGVSQTNGVYGSTTAPITGPGFIRVIGNLEHTQSANSITFTWVANSKLQSATNSITGPWFDYPDGGASGVTVPIDPANKSVFFRLAPLP